MEEKKKLPMSVVIDIIKITISAFIIFVAGAFQYMMF